MSLPHERTRALRWGWDFLQELQQSPCLLPGQRAQVKRLLQHYPSARELRQWTTGPGASPLRADLLAAEDGTAARSEFPEHIERPPVAPQQHIEAMLQALLFFRRLRTAPNLTLELQGQLPYVLRHYPDADSLERPIEGPLT